MLEIKQKCESVITQSDSTPPRATLKTANKAKIKAFLVDFFEVWQQPVANNKTYKVARLIHYGYNMARRWYVVFYAWDVSQDKRVRKRIFEPINREKNLHARMAVAEHVVSVVNAQLTRGQKLGTENEVQVSARLKTMTLNQVIEWAMVEKKNKNFSDDYTRKYKSIIANLNQWYEYSCCSEVKAKEFNQDMAHDFFDYLKNVKQLGNKTINNYRNDLATIFNYCERRQPGAFKKNPIANIEQLPTYTRKHAAFSDAQLKAIHDHVQQRTMKDQFLLFIQFIYYTLGRPKELMQLRSGDIDLEQNRILFRAEISKNRRDEYVAIAPQLKAIIEKSQLHKIDPSYYVFGFEHVPGPRPAGRHYFGKVNAQVLKAMDLNDKDYTLYGYKHSGAVSLYRATKDIKLVQSQCRHTSSTQTDYYLRDLGLLNEVDALRNWVGSI